MIACPTCQAENPDGFKFCGQCGLPLVAPPAQAEERKVVTTLFCDLVAFTAMSEAADPEDVDAILRQYHVAARKVIERHGGTVEKFIGDAVVGVFGVPAVHEDDPERAVRAGLRIVETLDGMARPDGSPLQVRVGVNSGEALVRLDVTPGSGEGFLTGDAVNTAARLQAAAPPGGVVVGATTHDLSIRAIVYEDLPPVAAKGKAEPVCAWLAGQPVARTGLRTAGLTTTPFLGREAELLALHDVLHQASCANEGRFVLLIGEPGIGKSRLVLEFARSLEESAELVTWRQGRCLPYGEGVTFWALGEILKAQAGILDSDDVATVESKLEAVLPQGEDRPWLRQRLRPLLGLEASQASSDENFAAWRRFLELIAARGATVLVLEDLHWADESMLAFVEYLRAEGLNAPMLVLGTARPELQQRSPGLLAPDGNARRLLVPRLLPEEVACLVSTLIDAELTETVAPLVERLSGNPLYAEQYVRLLLDRGLLVRGDGISEVAALEDLPLPETVQAVIAARLDALPPDHKALLCDAAVIGETFWRGAVAALSGRSDAEVEEVLRKLVLSELLRPGASSSMAGETEYVFWHALARDVAYSELPRKVRARKHQAAALWIEQEVGERRDDFCELLAHHYVTALDLARAAGEIELADSLLEPAIRVSGAAGEHFLFIDLATAERHLALALELAGDGPRRLPLLAGWGDVLYQRGRYAEAVDVLREAAEGLKVTGDIERAARALMSLVNPLTSMNDMEVVLRCAEEAVELLHDERHPDALLSALSHLAWTRSNAGDQVGAIETAEEAIKLAERWGVRDLIGPFGARGSARLALGDLGGLDDYELALEGARARGLTFNQAMLSSNLGEELLAARGTEPALEVWRNALVLARVRGIDAAVVTLRAAIIGATSYAGDWDEAIRLAEELDSTTLASGNLVDTARVRMTRGLVLLLRGDRVAARQAADWGLAVAVKESPAAVLYCCSLVPAVVDADEGNHVRAVELLHGLATRPLPAEDPVAAFMHPHAIRVALQLGEVPLAKHLLSVVEPLRPLNDHVLATGEALLAESRGELEPAAEEFGEAARGWHDFGVPYEDGQALLGQGRCLVALGRAPDAAAPLTAAREIFVRLGAKPALTETDEVMRQVASA